MTCALCPNYYECPMIADPRKDTLDAFVCRGRTIFPDYIYDYTVKQYKKRRMYE